MISSLDYVVLFFCLAVQARVSVLAWRRIARMPGVARAAARAIFLTCEAVFLVGCAYDSQAALGSLPYANHFAVLGAAVLMYTAVAAMALLLRPLMRAAGRKLGTEFNPGRRRLLNAAAGTLVAAPFAALAYGSFIGRTDLHVRELDVPLPGLPVSLDGLRLLHVSDIHLSEFLREAELVRMIDAANELKPHLTIFTGDLISNPGDPLDACIRQLARIKSDAGTLGCMGNHERYVGVEAYTKQAAARYGIRFLRQESATLKFGDAVMNFAGVDYQSLHDRKSYLRGAERLIQPGAVNVLLSHNPDVFPVAAQQGYNLVLAGHTHGGQVQIEILDRTLNPARFITPYVYGLYQGGNSAEYVSRGIGTIGMPVRIGAPPEISILRLRKA